MKKMDENQESVKNAKEQLMEYYGLDESQIHIEEVDDLTEFKDKWNGMGDDAQTGEIDAVIVIGHSSPNEMGFESGPNLDINNIVTLEQKFIDVLVLYGCSAGHYDCYNQAMVFSEVVNGAPVIASDGLVEIWHYKKEFILKSVAEGNYLDFLKEQRDNMGWLIYQQMAGKAEITALLGKENTLKDLLKYMDSVRLGQAASAGSLKLLTEQCNE